MLHRRYRVPLKEASRFGIMNTDGGTDRITEFVEKPPVPEAILPLWVSIF